MKTEKEIKERIKRLQFHLDHLKSLVEYPSSDSNLELLRKDVKTLEDEIYSLKWVLDI